MSNSLSKYEKMKSNLKKHGKLSSNAKELRDKKMKEESEKIKMEKIKADRNNIEEIMNDSKEIQGLNKKRISEEKEITEILEDLLLKKNYTEEDVRNSLNKNPALFQNLDMYFIKEKIDELLIIREERRKYNKIVIEAKEALRKVRTNYPFLM